MTRVRMDASSFRRSMDVRPVMAWLRTLPHSDLVLAKALDAKRRHERATTRPWQVIITEKQMEDFCEERSGQRYWWFFFEYMTVEVVEE